MLSHSPQQTRQYAQSLVDQFQQGGILCLYGDLGSGKTLFTKALLAEFGIPEKMVKSPTYTLLREYKTTKDLNIYHADFYRIEEIDELTRQNLEEIFNQPHALIVIEWAERIAALLPVPRVELHFEYRGDTERSIKKFDIQK